MALQDIIRKDISVVNSATELKEAAKLMYQNHVGSVVVVDKENGKQGIPIGILTDRDIALTFGKQGLLDPSCEVKEVMSTGVIVCSPEDGIYETISKMSKNGIRRMPVVNKQDQLLGVVESDDLFQLLGKEINELSGLTDYELAKEAKIEQGPDKNRQLDSRITRPRF